MSARSQSQPERHPHDAGPRGSATRVLAAWRAMHPDQRLAASTAAALFVTMLLPWYTETAISVKGTSVPRTANGTFTAFGAFSFVEAAVLLVSVFVICVVFARAEGRAFHLPGGDGIIIMLAGGWAAILIFYRMLDKPGLHTNGVLYTEGITWGIFIALFVALGLSYAGWRMHVAARPERPLAPPHAGPHPAGGTGRPRSGGARPAGPTAPARDADERDAAGDEVVLPDAESVLQRPRYPDPPAPPAGRGPAGRGPRPAPRRAVTREDAAQLSFDDPPTSEPFADDPPIARRPR